MCPSSCIQVFSGLFPIQQVMSPMSCTRSVPYSVADNKLALLAHLPDICVCGLQQLLVIGMRSDCMRHYWQHQFKDSSHWTFYSSSSLMNDSNADHILLDLTMFNTLFNAILLLNGTSTFQKWKLHMMAYIMSTGDSYILGLFPKVQLCPFLTLDTLLASS